MLSNSDWMGRGVHPGPEWSGLKSAEPAAGIHVPDDQEHIPDDQTKHKKGPQRGMGKKQKKQKRLCEAEAKAVDNVASMIMRSADPAMIEARLEAEARSIVRQMPPAEIATMLHPDGKLVPLKRVPQDVINDHLGRYSMEELGRGQFIVVMGSEPHYVFVMDHKANEMRQLR